MARPELTDWIYRQLKAGKDLHSVKREIEANGGLDDYSYERDRSIDEAIGRLKTEDKNFAYWLNIQLYQDIYVAAGITILVAVAAFTYVQ